jgi:hypothetical protein
MARIRWQGSTFNATPKEQLPNGDWLMVATDHGARFVPGDTIRVQQQEIIDMGSAPEPTPATIDASRAALETMTSMPSARSKRPSTPRGAGTRRPNIRSMSTVPNSPAKRP